MNELLLNINKLFMAMDGCQTDVLVLVYRWNTKLKFFTKICFLCVQHKNNDIFIQRAFQFKCWVELIGFL